MSNPKSLYAWADIRAVMDRAVSSEKPLELKFANKKAANRFRLSCYSIRHNDRKASKRIYTRDEPEYDSSPYDELSFTFVNPEDPRDGRLIISKASGQLEGVTITELDIPEES